MSNSLIRSVLMSKLQNRSFFRASRSFFRKNKDSLRNPMSEFPALATDYKAKINIFFLLNSLTDNQKHKFVQFRQEKLVKKLATLPLLTPSKRKLDIRHTFRQFARSPIQAKDLPTGRPKSHRDFSPDRNHPNIPDLKIYEAEL